MRMLTLRLASSPRARYGALLVLLFALGIALGLGPSTVTGTRNQQEDVRFASIGNSMAELLAVAPFNVRQPALPKGFGLISIQYNPPTMSNGKSVFAVDFHYANATGERMHVWQTNIPNLAEYGKDPTDPSRGDSVTVNGSTWQLVRIDDARGHTSALSRRLADGVTISIDSEIDEAVLKGVAASID